MLKRTVTGIILIGILIPSMIFSDTLFFVCLLAVFTVIGVFEMLRCFDMQKRVTFALPVYLLSAVAPFAARYLPEGNFYRFAYPAILMCIVLMLGAYTFSKGGVTLEQACGSIACCVYIAASFCSIVLLRDIPLFGKFIYVFVFIGAWITDIFAYFTGVLVGKHKLIPKISPKKTVEGSIGGILFCTLAFVIYGIILNRIVPAAVPNYPVLVVGGILTSAVAQVGDLMMSAIKRARGIKDFGKIFPGHGGVLDRFDSVMPVSLMLLSVEAFFDLFLN